MIWAYAKENSIPKWTGFNKRKDHLHEAPLFLRQALHKLFDGCRRSDRLFEHKKCRGSHNRFRQPDTKYRCNLTGRDIMIGTACEPALPFEDTRTNRGLSNV